jgi:CubicO group peptidase (beta-lactamase class C family)
MTLRSERPEEVGFREGGMLEVDRVVEQFLEKKAFPGAVVAVGKDGALVHLSAFGRQTYDAKAPRVTADTIYDLASLTKVTATTTMAMILVDEGRLDLAKPVGAFLPKFSGGDKDGVTVWHLLTHSSGVDWWAPLHKDAKTKEGYLEKIYAMDLTFAPGTKSVYSDLGILLLGEILERVAGQPVAAFARRRVFEPLGMKDTLYRPPHELLPRIAPTENDAEWRKRVVHGEVHDENAFGLSGIAPHAGLFGTASDLARFAQMLLNGGTLDGKRILSPKTVTYMTSDHLGTSINPGSLYLPGAGFGFGLGFAVRKDAGVSPFAGTVGEFNWGGAGGTYFWVDPKEDMFVVFMMQSPKQRVPYRHLLKEMVYAAVTKPAK